MRAHWSSAFAHWVGFNGDKADNSGCTAMLLFNVGLASTGFFPGSSSNRAALGMLLLWVLSYGASAGPNGFVAAGETSTPRLRANTTAFNLACYGAGL